MKKGLDIEEIEKNEIDQNKWTVRKDYIFLLNNGLVEPLPFPPLPIY